MAKGYKTGGRVKATPKEATRRIRRRFFARIESGPDHLNDCWLWTDALVRGYGRFGFWLDGRMRHASAHRFAYQMFRPIPEGLHLDHLCRVPRCVNPLHLEPVTLLENTRRRAAPGCCLRGHVLADVGQRRDTDGHLRCLECRRLNKAAYYQRIKERRKAKRLAECVA